MAAKALSRKQLIASALCNYHAVDPKTIPEDIKEVEIESYYLTILKTAKKEASQNDEVVKWIKYAAGFPSDPKACDGALKELNGTLVDRTVLLGNGHTPSEADVSVLASVHSYVHNVDLGNVLEKIGLEQVGFDFGKLDGLLKPKTVAKEEVDTNAKKTVQSTKSADKPDPGPISKKSETGAKTTGYKKATQEKSKAPEVEAAEKDKEVSVSLLNIQVGLIRKAWKHPSSDSLLVEEIDLGEAKLRRVVSGLAKFCSPEELTNLRVVLITNVEPGKLRDVVSEGLVLCASSADHTLVEPLLPPEGAKIGERVSFSGIDGKPEDVLNPKKKQLDKITPHLFTDDKGVATFKVIICRALHIGHLQRKCQVTM